MAEPPRAAQPPPARDRAGPTSSSACNAAAATRFPADRESGGGSATDLLVRAGATVMFSEVTEVRDGVDQLTARAPTPKWPRR